MILNARLRLESALKLKPSELIQSKLAQLFCCLNLNKFCSFFKLSNKAPDIRLLSDMHCHSDLNQT